MQSSMIGKIEKAKRYAMETDRITFTEFALTFRGEHDDYKLRFENGIWHCTCNFFSQRGLCSHTMALEKVLGDMLPGKVPDEQLALIPNDQAPYQSAR